MGIVLSPPLHKLYNIIIKFNLVLNILVYLLIVFFVFLNIRALFKVLGHSPHLVKISPHLGISVNNKKLNFFMVDQWAMPHLQIKNTCFAQPSTKF